VSLEPRLVEVRQNVLKQNDLLARALRTRFREAGAVRTAGRDKAYIRVYWT
jgi:hypothetical protein